MGFWDTMKRGTGAVAKIGGDVAIGVGAATGNPAAVAGGMALRNLGKQVSPAKQSFAGNHNVAPASSQASTPPPPLPIRAGSQAIDNAQQRQRMGAIYG